MIGLKSTKTLAAKDTVTTLSSVFLQEFLDCPQCVSQATTTVNQPATLTITGMAMIDTISEVGTTTTGAPLLAGSDQLWCQEAAVIGWRAMIDQD